MKDPKRIQLLSPPCGHGRAKALITDGETTTIGEVEMRHSDDSRPMQPGETMLTLEQSATPGGYKVTGSYTHEGPPRAATPKYRKNYDKIFGSRKPSTDPKELN